MTSKLQFECDVKFASGRHSAKQIVAHKLEEPKTKGRLPRVTKLMALAIRFDQLVRDGVVRDYAELAQFGHVSRARITQIMNLTMLAPDIQEQILHSPTVDKGKDPICMSDLQRVAGKPNWQAQRKAWAALKSVA